MARPIKPLKKRASGIYFLQLTDKKGRRHTLSLDTKDATKALARSAEGLERLHRQMEQAQGGQPVWRSDELFETFPHTDERTGLPDASRPVYERAVNVVHQDQIRQMDWADLIREASAKFKRNNGKDYSDSWYANTRSAIKSIPHKNPLLLTPKQLNAWIKAQQEEGVAPKTIQARASSLSGLITSCIKTSFLEGFDNPFQKVDYATTVVVHHQTALGPDYEKWFKEVRATAPTSKRLAVDLMIYLGCRVKEVLTLAERDVDWKKGTVTIGVKVRKEEEKRTVPVPDFLMKELLVNGFNFVSNTTINKLIKEVNPQLTSHGWRHGWKRLSRDHHLDSRLAEAFMGHSLPGMEAVYGDGYSVQAFKEGVAPIWSYLDTMREATAPD